MKNPLIERQFGKYSTIPFSQIKIEHFIPAVEFGIETAYVNLKKIKDSKNIPDFKNTIEALEFLSDDLDRITNIYYNLYSLDSDDEFKKIAEFISPKLAGLSNEIYTDGVIFGKVQSIFSNRFKLKLSLEETRLLEITYSNFTRNGALLTDDKKEELRAIDQELSLLNPQFSKNVLDGTNSYEFYLDNPEEIKGIPETALKNAEHLAHKKGHENGWLFTLQMPSYIPVLQYADNRDLRKKLSNAYGIKNLDGKFDNCNIIIKTIELRHRRAQLLGYKNHAEYVLEKRMAGNPSRVSDFLENIYNISFPIAEQELEKVKQYALDKDNITDFQSWDSSYYSQKLKKELYDFDNEELRPYFKSENVLNGIFKVANKLYDLNFIPDSDIEKYHEDVTTYRVENSDSHIIGLLYIDLYPRETKRSGAWMNTFQTQGLCYNEEKIPHVLISANLTPSTPDMPSLLSLDEVRTIFHEFGHALHGLLSNVKYRSLASPNVFWDFVELPSQIMENWLFEKETLELFAFHYKSGEILPLELVEKIRKSITFNAATMNIRQLSLATLDMAWHTTTPKDIVDVIDFEDSVTEKFRLLPKTPSNTSTGFSHIFAGGYSAGYYSYKWAEVLDADAFELFKEKGIFNRELSDKFREIILSKGNTIDPMDLYVKFRGAEPDANALLRRDGLIK